MRNLSVLEGGRGRFQNGVRRVIADLQGGGTSIWVPAEERLLKTKYITENGTYLASAEEIWGFSKLTVNVAGGAEGTQVPTIDKDGNPTDYQVPTYGPVTVDPNIDPSDYPTLPPISGGIGSQITGIDPISGNPVIATVEPNGEISLEPLPAKLHIGRLPDKLTYADGETIDIGGIQCFLLNEDNTVYDYGKYSKEVAHKAGLVPRSELTFEPMVADKTKIVPSSYDYDGIHAVRITANGEEIHGGSTATAHIVKGYRCDIFPHIAMNPYGSVAYITRFSNATGSSTFMQIMNETTALAILDTASGDGPWGTWPQIKGPTDGFVNVYSYRTSYGDFPASESNPSGKSIDPSKITSGGMEVTVSWTRQDGKVLTDTFEVRIADQAAGGGGGFSGGGGGGQGGDGGGGAF